MVKINAIMIRNVHCKAFILGLFLLLNPLCCPAIDTSSGPVFFIGEDIIHPQGLVVAVNEISRKPYTEGLGNSLPKEDLILNLTLMNNGLTSRLENRMWYFGETEQQAREALAKINEEQQQSVEQDIMNDYRSFAQSRSNE